MKGLYVQSGLLVLQSDAHHEYDRIAECPSEEDAAFVTRACNAHQELVEALEKAYRELNAIRAADGVPYHYDGVRSCVDEAYFSSVVDECRQALAKAKGE